MQDYLVEMLACPACRGELDWSIGERLDGRILTAQARCWACGAAYPVRAGIALFLTSNLPREDLWQQVESRLARFLREHPEVERRLMLVPPETLNPADQFFRALALEERGSYAEAKAVEDLAHYGMYTPDYRSCWEKQCNYVLERLSTTDGPIVDLASGRCALVEKMAQQLTSPIVATDFSPRVLIQDRRRLEAGGMYDRVSLLACDARRMPFKTGAIQSLTTNLGLPNIQDAGDLLAELRRATAGKFLAISHFYPEDDAANAQKIRALGLEPFLFRRTALESFAQAGWEVNLANTCLGKANPTPVGVVIEGADIDALPLAATTLQWCVLEAVPH